MCQVSVFNTEKWENVIVVRYTLWKLMEHAIWKY